MKKSNLRLFFTITPIIIIALSFVLLAGNTNAQTTTISEGLALDLALSYSKDNGLGGWVTQPEKAYGQVISYGEAVQFVSNRPIDPNTKQYERRDMVVWLIVLEGQFIEHVPSYPASPDREAVIFPQKKSFMIKW